MPLIRRVNAGEFEEESVGLNGLDFEFMKRLFHEPVTLKMCREWNVVMWTVESELRPHSSGRDWIWTWT